jgi:NHL repeat/WD40-like Beta Propeller Repeat
VNGAGSAPFPLRRALFAAFLSCLALALFAASAQAFRGHVFGGTFGEAGAGDGQLSEPSGLAANEATGKVYVLDQGNGRIQIFSSAGVYQGQFDGPTATGTGTLTSGSATIEALATSTGAFAVGEEVVGTGIPAGITVKKLISATELELSAEATASAADVALTAHQAFKFGATALAGGIAVDNSCYIEKLSGSACATADPSNGDVYVTDPGNGVVDKFNPAGMYLGQLREASGDRAFEFRDTFGELGHVNGVGVDASGTVWVYYGTHVTGDAASFTSAEPNTFTSSGQLAWGGQSGGFNEPGFAVDSAGNLYARRGEPNAVSKFGFSSHNGSYPILLEPFVAEETSAVAVDLSNDEVFLDNVGSVGAFSATGSLQERFGSGHLTSGSGLAISHPSDPRYSTVYVANSVAGEVDVFPPEPPGPPSIQAGSESVSEVTADSATFAAEINPRSESNEQSTSYRFEYGSCATPATCATSPYEASAPLPADKLSPDFELHLVTAHAQGLRSRTVYHFRLVAENHLGAAEGEELTFTTQTPAPFTLPDSRAWEMVSPPDKLGALIEPIGGFGLVQASAKGDAITYVTTSPTETEPQGYAVRVQALSTRGPSGWSSRDLTVPHPLATGPSVGQGVEYRFASEDLSLGVLQPFGAFDPSLSEEASEQTAFLRANFRNGDVDEPCLPTTMHCYRPLVSAENATSGLSFGEEGECTPAQGEQLICGPRFIAATSDLSHVVLQSGMPLTATMPMANKGGLYEWSAGALQLISVLPRNAKGEEGPASNPQLGYVDQDARHAISADGSRMVWSEGGAGGHLYMRDTALGETVQLDAVQGGSGSNEAKPIFQGASADGSRILFTDSQRLTSDSGGLERSADLYQCEMVEEAGKLHCDLSDLTPLSSGESAAVLGAVLGSSENGSYVYFVANGTQEEDPGAVHGGECAGRFAPLGATCNLYVRHGGVTKLVAVLSAEDAPDWAAGNSESLGGLTARVSPDGEWLAFMSQRSLTGYDNHDANSGEPDEEVYLYGAGSGALICVSCNPTGARPVGFEVGSKQRLVDTVNGGPYWPSQTWLAANIPGWTPYKAALSLYQSRYLSDSGRLFFNSNDALVPQDANGVGDVYEYEPPGVGDCTEASATFGRVSGGCLGLISSGTSKEESAFLDASESGDDVFFLTNAQLSHRDTDTSLDIYDARSGGGEAEPVKPVECQGDACQQPATVPEDPTPSSLTYSGPGNEVPPVKAKKPRHKAKKHSRKSHKKRAHKRAAKHNHGGAR